MYRYCCSQYKLQTSLGEEIQISAQQINYHWLKQYHF